jgi:uncharacterized damage-inducible protein DinB
MNMRNELQEFLAEWELQADGTLALIRALPHDQYDFRPDAAGRSIGELAWHLAELEAYVSQGIEQGEFRFAPPRIAERPRTVEALAPAFRLVHDDAVARVARLQPADLDRDIRAANGEPWSIRRLLRQKLLMHGVHHRGQLTLLCRLAGGVPPGLFGPNREEAAARRASATR